MSLAGTSWYLLFFPHKGTFIVFLYILQNSPSWAPTEEWQRLKMGKPKLHNSTTHQVGGKRLPLPSVTRVSSAAWSALGLLHRAGCHGRFGTHPRQVWPCHVFTYTELCDTLSPTISCPPGCICRLTSYCHACHVHRFHHVATETQGRLMLELHRYCKG